MKSSKCHFVSVDWGTTNFRLRLADRTSGEIIQEFKSDQGVLKVYDKFVKQQEISQKDFFASYLLTTLSGFYIETLDLPIVLSGMASSTIGLQELPYAEFPFDQEGDSLKWIKSTLHNGLKIILVSGVRSDTGMIRGEEIQAIGLAKHITNEADNVLILPGTHSKHMIFTNKTFSGLRNYMTGELFEVLSSKSILAKSVQKSTMNSYCKNQFLVGLEQGIKGSLGANLLSVRANQVLHDMHPSENYFFLSGLLIGEELKDLGDKVNVYLSATEPLYSLYKIALQHVLPTEKLFFFDENITDSAVILGHIKILKQVENESTI